MKKITPFLIPSPRPGRGGSHNGYAAIPEGHPLWGVDYTLAMGRLPQPDDGSYIQELTYSGRFSDLNTRGLRIQCRLDGNLWVFGFDTLHSWNTAAEDEPWCQAEAEKLAAVLEKARALPVDDDEDECWDEEHIVFTGEDVPAPIPTERYRLPSVEGHLFACYLTGQAEALFGFDIPCHVAGTIEAEKATQPCTVIDKQGCRLPATLFIEQRYGSIGPSDGNPLGVSPRGYIVLDTDDERTKYHKGKQEDRAKEWADKVRAILSYVKYALTDLRRRGVAPAGSERLINELSDYSLPLKQLLTIEDMQGEIRQWRDDHDCPADKDDHDTCTCNEFDQVLDGLDRLTKLINR